MKPVPGAPPQDPQQKLTGQNPRRALVLGGGFSGLEAAIRLRRAGLSVTLVSQRPELFIYPTSIWIVTGAHRVEHDTLDLADLAAQHGFQLVVGAVERVDTSAKRVVVDGTELEADILIVALGAARRRPAGIEHTHTIWGEPADTQATADRVAALVERGHGRIAVGFGGSPGDPSAVRGGPAFEVMFNIDHLLRKRGLRDRFELTFFAPMPNPGSRMGEEAARAVHVRLGKLAIRKRFGTKIRSFDPAGVLFEDDSRLDADLVIFVPGGKGHPAVEASGLPVNEAGFIHIDDQCRIVGHDDWYAIGDVAELRGPDFRAKQGHLAEVMARIAVKDIVARSRGERSSEGYVEHVGILCLMDTGNGGAWVSRSSRRATVVFLPWLGHLLKRLWGAYYRWTKYRFGRWLIWSLRTAVRATVRAPVAALPPSGKG